MNLGRCSYLVVPGLPTTELYQPAARLRGYSQALFSWKPKPTFERAAPAFQPWRLVAVPPNFEALIDSRFNFCHSMQWRIQYPQDAKRLFCGFVMAYFQRAGHFARVPDASQLWDTLESPIQMAWVIASAYTKQKFRDLFLGLPYHMAAISIAAAPWVRFYYSLPLHHANSEPWHRNHCLLLIPPANYP